MRVEREYTDVLQNIEFAIVLTYRQYPQMTDYSVMRALEALVDAYNGEQIGRAPRNFRLSELENALKEAIYDVCEWRLGRIEPEDESAEPMPAPAPLTIDEILLCLKKIQRSVEKWNKSGGIRGYLDFIIQYVA
jgi:hypothetical protein